MWVRPSPHKKQGAHPMLPAPVAPARNELGRLPVLPSDVALVGRSSDLGLTPVVDPLELGDEILRLKERENATILAHYYQDGEIQELADYTGDSLQLARAATKVTTPTIVFCGVHFMAETAKMLNPEKRVLLPDLLAG